MRTRAALLVTSLLIAVAGCSGEPAGKPADASGDAADAQVDRGGSDTPGDACTAVVGGTFVSTSLHECGLTPDGAASCFWSVRFTDNGATRELSWHYSDVTETLVYTCSGWTLAAGSYAGTYDPTTGILTWDGVEYHKAVR